MTPEERDRLKPLFDRALGLDPPERAAFIEQLRLDDEETALDLASILEDADQTNSLDMRVVRLRDLMGNASTSCFAAGELVLNRFRIVRFLGRGGMGEVWEATDLHLGRVALKTIRAEIAASEQGLARFRREVRLARKIGHPNVCRIHDIFDVPARLGQSALSFLTMEYLAGVTLAEHIAGSGPLPLADAESVALQVCSAVQSIHDAGIIHRDLKASNIMLATDPAVPGQNRAVVMDLGLARETESEVGGESEITRANAVMGTPEYMAPEQFAGRNVMATADIYALGIVLYEMVTGSRPFHAATPMGAAVMRGKRPPAASSLRPDLPRLWDEVIDKCLEFDPERRFASARALATRLRSRLSRRQLMARYAAAAVLAAAGIAGIAGLSRATLIHWPGFSNGVATAQARTLVVLPFENIGANPANQAFCDGLQETTASMLSGAAKLRDSILVVPSSEVRGNQIKTITDARKLFGAKLALTGSVQDVADGLQIALNLTDAQTLRQQDSRLLLVKRNEMAGLQQRLAEEIDSLFDANQTVLSQVKTPGETTHDSEAYRLYVQGQGGLRSGNVDLAVDDLRKAVARDPAFTAAEARLAEAYLVKYNLTKDPTWLAQADAAESNATRDGQTPETRYVQAMIWQSTGENDKAVSSFRQILQTDPANVDVWNRLANALQASGKVKEAEETFQTAVRLRPGYWPIYNDMGTFYLNQRDYPKAEQSLLTGIKIAPEVPRLHSNLGAVYFTTSRWDEAAREFEKSVALKPYALGYSNIGTVRFFQGKYAEAARQFEEATRLQPANYLNWGNLGDAYWQLAGERDAARTAFEKAALLANQRLVLNPGDADVRCSYALYQAKTGHIAEARAGVEAAITRAPENMDVRYDAARVYAVTGDLTHALAALKKALALGYDMQAIDREPDFNVLRKDPRYRQNLAAQK